VTYSSAQLKWTEESLLFSIGVGVPMKMERVSKRMFIINLADMDTLTGAWIA
jgi:GH43 family beta-xylosidase